MPVVDKWKKINEQETMKYAWMRKTKIITQALSAVYSIGRHTIGQHDNGSVLSVL